MTLTEKPLAAPGSRVPPWNEKAERDVLGALLGPFSGEATALLEPLLRPEMFRKPAHQHIAAAVFAVWSRTEPPTPVTVGEELRRVGLLDQVGGVEELLSLIGDGVAPSTSVTYARIIAGHHRNYLMARAAQELLAAAVDGDPAGIDRALALAAGHAGTIAQAHGLAGGSFALDAPAGVEAIWGADSGGVLWAQGESLLIVGPAGVGKTTVAQQLALARCGLRSHVLGMQVAPSSGRVLYVAADRPAQARRSFARMVTEADREVLDARLVVWPGPLPADLTSSPRALLDLAERHHADTVVLDSLKDVVVDLEKPEGGAKYNQARQAALAAGVEVIELHHQRKGQQGAGRPRHLDDVYGSTWITAGAGSVLLLWGEAGDAVVEAVHLKQPAESVGPLQVLHDQHTGCLTVEDRPDVYSILRSAPRGMTAMAVAHIVYSSDARNDIERARRQLDSLVRAGKAHRQDGQKGGRDGGSPALYFVTTGARDDGR